MISFALDSDFHGLKNDILEPYKRFILFLRFYFGKMWKSLEKRPFFWADMAGLGKCCTGGYGRIGAYRVNCLAVITVASIIIENLDNEYFPMIGIYICVYFIITF